MQVYPGGQPPQSKIEVARSFALKVPLVQGVGTVLFAGQKKPRGQG